MTLIERPRRLRSTSVLRAMVRDTSVAPASLILPVFIREGLTTPKPIEGMPGVVQHTKDSYKAEIDLALEAGIGGVMVFGIPEKRDPSGTEALNPEGVLSSAIREARTRAGDDLVIVADLCLDEFTSHGHCGVLDKRGNVENDATLKIYGEMAKVLAASGAHMVGTSGMMDGQVGVVRDALDSDGYTDVLILAYAAKFASAFYGPFRDAVESQLQGNRNTYQQDPGNIKESMREVRLDVSQGADIVMVKPSLAYLDILYAASQAVDVPTASYIVSGEMAMIEAAAAQGSLDRERAILEVLSSVKRAGASVICTYWAIEAAHMLKRNLA
ncbi:MAG: porphobilinogen synthase [Candidatus Nanopelagicaceae bacterium]|nr:porphobilinogen synthase [Candidatus Nanopelagicaceae bacterium]